MKVEDSKALKEYQEKLKRARCTGNLIDPDESLTVRMNRIQRAKREVSCRNLSSPLCDRRLCGLSDRACQQGDERSDL